SSLVDCWEQWCPHGFPKVNVLTLFLIDKGPMLAMLPPGPEFMELMLIWLPIWPMLLELVAMGTLRFMPLPLYMLLPACWLHLLGLMLPCVQPFMSGEDWKEVLPCACCIMGLWAWPILGDMRGL
uniref:Uncharacterized protein n=2 Tax=Cyprinus carpio TaxID=7962 RepID=A0A9J8APC7_CYPCA